MVGCTFTFRTSVRIPRKALTMATIALQPRNSVTAQNPYKSTKTRLTPRGRVVARFAVVISFAIVGVAGYSAMGSPEGQSQTTYQEIVVTPGQTLWNIASQVSGGVDIPGMVDEIVSLNSLRTPEVSAGQHLYLPSK